ncbi:hypothetical protein AAVH_13990 [Aphelenchoides avenae]|nr:hypothetical protein AAVH_13990 [Aphelenchus avenae]
MDEYKNDETSDDFSELEDGGEKMDELEDFEVDVESATSSDRHDVPDGDTVVDAKAEMERLYEEVMNDLEEDVRGTEADVLVMEDELKELKAEKSSLKKEVRGHKKRISRLNSELRKQKRMLDYVYRQQSLREIIENYELGPNEVFMDEDEFEDLDAGASSESKGRIKKREKKAKKAEARQDALEKTLQDLEETEAAIAQADVVTEDAEIDIFLMGLHAENMQKIIEDAPAEKSRARHHLDAIQVDAA